MRLGDVSERIRAMLRIDKIEKEIYNEVDACLIQLSAIADRRHRLVHRVSNYAFGTLIVTNHAMAKSMENAEFERFDTPELNDMHRDYLRIFLRLNYVVYPEEYAKEPVSFATG